MKRSGLSRSVEATRAWQDRSRKAALRKGMKSMGMRRTASRPLRRTARKRRAKIPTAVRARVKARSRGKCIACDTYPPAPIDQLHHVLPVRDFPELEWTEDNLVGVCVGCHDEHERAHRRIPWRRLPPCARELVDKVGVAAQVYAERTYPR